MRADASSDRLRQITERNVRAVTLRPGVGRGTAVTTARVREGTCCEVRERDWTLVTDMSEKAGGEGRGPNPGTLGRAALASCMAVGYMTWAARREVPIAALEVDVEADYDVRGELGVDGVSPAYERIRCVVYVESEAPESVVLSVLREAETRSTYWRLFGGRHDGSGRLCREAWITRPAATAGTPSASAPTRPSEPGG